MLHLDFPFGVKNIPKLAFRGVIFGLRQNRLLTSLAHGDVVRLNGCFGFVRLFFGLAAIPARVDARRNRESSKMPMNGQCNDVVVLKFKIKYCWLK